jgi:hypothetical protein
MPVLSGFALLPGAQVQTSEGPGTTGPNAEREPRLEYGGLAAGAAKPQT